MRLWHKELINVLPRNQLIAQWRECRAIAGSILKNGTPNMPLVNKVLDFDMNHFLTYCLLVRSEMTRRGYSCRDSVWEYITRLKPEFEHVTFQELFKGWHTYRYKRQCFCNLQEKYDCGMIPENVYALIEQECHDLI